MIGYFFMDDCTLTNVSNLVIEESCGEEFFLNIELSSYLAKCSFTKCTAVVCNSTHGYLCFRHYLLARRYSACGYTELADQIELEHYIPLLEKLIAWYSNCDSTLLFGKIGVTTRSNIAEFERKVFAFFTRFPLENLQSLYPIFRSVGYWIQISRFWRQSLS
jgi:hypothetical protein